MWPYGVIEGEGRRFRLPGKAQVDLVVGDITRQFEGDEGPWFVRFIKTLHFGVFAGSSDDIMVPLSEWEGWKDPFV